jgi:ribosomal protein L21
MDSHFCCKILFDLTINKGNIERQSLDSSIAESEKKKKENRSNELKLREQKLRKREEELKIREKLSEEMQNARIWLQSYVAKLEGRVNELERSNKILQQKCESMAHHQNEQCIRQNSTKDPSSSLRRIAARFLRFASPHLVSL